MGDVSPPLDRSFIDNNIFERGKENVISTDPVSFEQLYDDSCSSVLFDRWIVLYEPP